MTEDTPQAVWSGEFDLGHIKVKCHVLSDGRRVIEQESIAAFFSASLDDINEEDLLEFTRWMKGIS